MNAIEIINNPVHIDPLQISSAVAEGKQVIVQFSSRPYTSAVLSTLNNLCQTHGSHLGVRFYGHYSEPFDAAVLSALPDLQILLADCLAEALHADAITRLPLLKSLSLGIKSLPDPEFLQAKNFEQIEYLSLEETRLNLKYLKNWPQLKCLKLIGPYKNMEAIGEVPGLEELVLSSVGKAPITFINKLHNLKSLRILLGSRDNIHELQGNNIEHLEISWVKGFNDFRTISDFQQLKTLSIEDEKQLSELAFTRPMNELTHIKISNCKSLRQISGMELLPSLQSLFLNGTSIDFETLISRPLPPGLQFFEFYTGKTKSDEAIKAAILQKGYQYS